MSASPHAAWADDGYPGNNIPDDISLTSTLESQHDSEFEFEVEEIHAEDVDPADPTKFRYLIEWTGYHMDRWTWEPAHHVGHASLQEWEEKKARQALGLSQPFDVALFDEAVRHAERQRFERHRARNFRRKREGLPMVLYPGEMEAEYVQTIHISDDDDDEMDDFNDILPPPKPVMSPKSHETTGTVVPAKSDGKLPGALPQESEMAKPRQQLQEPRSNTKKQSKSKATTTIGYQGTARRSTATTSDKTLPVNKTTTTDKDKDASATPSQKAKKSNVKPQARSASGNIFVAGKPPRARQSLGDALHDTSKQPRQFGYARQLNRASKYSREVADRAPANPHLLNLQTLSSISDDAAPTPLAESVNDVLSAHAKHPLEDVTATARLREPGANLRDTVSSESQGQPSVKKSALRKTQDSVPADGKDQPPAKKTRSVRFTGDEPGSGSPFVTTKILDDAEIVGEPEFIVIDDDGNDDGGLFVGDLPAPRFASEARLSTPPRQYIAPAPETPIPSQPVMKAMAATVTIGPSGSPTVNVAFEGLPSEPSPWQARLRQNARFQFSHVCSAYAFEKRLLASIENPLAWGEVVPQSTCSRLDVAADQLRLGSFAAVCHTEGVSILVFSAKCEEWKAICPIFESTASASAALRYMIFKAGKAGQFLPPPAFAVQRTEGPTSGDFALQIFGLDYGQLLPDELRRNRGQHNFFLAFPPSRGSLLNMVCAWLRSLNPKCRIFTSDVPGDWNAYLQAAETECGTFVLHEKALPTIRFFTGIQKLLQAESSRSTFWRFQEKLQHMKLRPPGRQHSEGYAPFDLSRLFPAGDAVFVTPSFLVTQPQQAHQLFSWYKSRLNHAGAYIQLVTSSGIVEFLGALAMRKMEERTKMQKETERPFGTLGLTEKDCKARFATWQLVSDLVSVKTTGSGGGALVFADETIHPGDEQSLLNWYAFWSGSNLHQYRNFRVIGSSEVVAQRAMTAIETPTFARGTVADPDHARASPPTIYLKAMSHMTEILRGDGGAEFTRYLGQPSLQKRPLMKVYLYPISYIQSPAEMANHFGDHWEAFTTVEGWIKWMWDFSRPSSFSKKVVNTQLCFCYTITGEWNPADYKYGIFPQRHPWIGILRPTNVHQLPFKSLELLIWDVSMPEMCPGDDDVDESQLLPAQQAFIQTVRRQVPGKHKMKLERVWVGGFHLPSEDAAPAIDHTLKMMEAMAQDIKKYLPPSEQMLETRGFRRVKQPDAYPSRPGPVYSVFHPPANPTTQSEKSRCSNSFLREARIALRSGQGTSTMMFHYKATKQWYAEQEAEGRHFEHIQVDTWQVVSRALGVPMNEGGN